MTSRRKDKDKGKRLSVLTDAEKFALYGLPDFDEGQQLEYLSLTPGTCSSQTNVARSLAAYLSEWALHLYQ